MFKTRLLAFIILFLCLAVPVSATTIIELSLNEMTKASTDVVHGEVLSQSTQWKGDLIVTTSTVEVHDPIVGDSNVVEVEQLGGTVNEVSQKAHGVTLLKPQQEVILFLQPVATSGLHKVTGMQGIYLIRNGMAVPTKSQKADYVKFDSLGKLQPATSQKESLKLDQLIHRIRSVDLSD